MKPEFLTTPLEVTDKLPSSSREKFAAALRVAFWALGILFVVYFLFLGELPIEQSIGSEISPDGHFRAEYSWRPMGLMCLFTHNGTAMYLTVRDQVSGRVIHRVPMNADGISLDEAEDRLQSEIPWRHPASH